MVTCYIMNEQTMIFKKGYKPKLSEGSIITPIFKSSTFCFEKSIDGARSFQLAYGLDQRKDGEDPCLIYSRVNNPNMEIVEEKLAVLDSSDTSLIFSSGMAAISTTCLTFLNPGDSLIYSSPVYGGTDYFFKKYLPSKGIECYEFSCGSSYEEMLELGKKCKNLKVIFIESPCNPLIKLTSLSEVEKVKKELNIMSIVDNTFCGPYYLRPLKFGCDIVLYSVSKFIGGHSDIIAGSVSGSFDLLKKIKGTRTILGSISDPDTCWLVQRSLATLKMRMEKQCRNAKKIVKMLLMNSKVQKIYYPGIGDENDVNIFNKEYEDSGSIISFKIHGSKEDCYNILDNCKIFNLALSLGSVESLIEHPSSMTHSDLSEDDKIKYGITDNLIRCSVGIESSKDLIDDLASALNCV